ncbi:MAG: uracil phosphoribosyltransferase [Defluviitaleaceae bacterium]|nr:uracil phosphoribosyltransferase [Defluviitaleaceae bacterium]
MLKIIEHPLIQHKISMIRDKETGHKDFRQLVSEIATILCYEATLDDKVKEIEIETPIITCKGKVLAKDYAVVPILRAGLGMEEGVLRLLPMAAVGHIGLYRDPKTLMPVEYYTKLPSNIEERQTFVLDPMLATGGSASEAINIIKAKGARNIKFLCVVSCPEGVEFLEKNHPDVPIYTAVHDSKLNEKGYIVPGLGDAGDRLFGTQ